MSPIAASSDLDRFLIVDDSDDDITQIILVACQRPVRWTQDSELDRWKS